jgi:hypothetical protein
LVRRRVEAGEISAHTSADHKRQPKRDAEDGDCRRGGRRKAGKGPPPWIEETKKDALSKGQKGGILRIGRTSKQRGVVGEKQEVLRGATPDLLLAMCGQLSHQPSETDESLT